MLWFHVIAISILTLPPNYVNGAKITAPITTVLQAQVSLSLRQINVILSLLFSQPKNFVLSPTTGEDGDTFPTDLCNPHVRTLSEAVKLATDDAVQKHIHVALAV